MRVHYVFDLKNRHANNFYEPRVGLPCLCFLFSFSNKICINCAFMMIVSVWMCVFVWYMSLKVYGLNLFRSAVYKDPNKELLSWKRHKDTWFKYISTTITTNRTKHKPEVVYCNRPHPREISSNDRLSITTVFLVSQWCPLFTMPTVYRK